ncbi:hypothetical protein AB0K00_20570 [Dactylosporangium sp. NPDC049525]|uniref:hypothetical protein n=1 Tax=Dactylosporangium sp. NPDC049525 TaxID=3154730 RepID=UPI003420368A
MKTVPPTPATLGPAHAAVVRAVEELAAWHGPDPSGARVRAGHDAITAIDTALRALYDARAALVTEIHADNVERAARVDELLARVRAERFGHPDGFAYTREPEEFVADESVPPGVEGWRVDGRNAR